MKKPNKPSSASKGCTPVRSARSSSGKTVGRETARTGRFPATLRVKSRADFGQVFRDGKVATDGTLVLHAVDVRPERTQLGLSLSKKVGCAPVRNRWKRLIREAFRTNYSRLPAGLRIIARPRRGAKPDYWQIEASLLTLSAQLAKKCHRQARSKHRDR